MSWGNLLIASGGALKPPKCFSHIISFHWNQDETWAYDANKEDEEMIIWVPMVDGRSDLIKNLSVDTPKETLGVFTCPSGSITKALKEMQSKSTDWANRALGSSIC